MPMMTRFHAIGASAGTLKWSNELSIPTTSPEMASSPTIGNISRESETVSASSSGSKPGANSGMSAGAATMKPAVIAPRTTVRRKKTPEATRKASRRSPFSSSSVKTGTKAPWSAASANSARTRFGT